MNDKYLRELRRHLRCSRKTQKRLSEQFKAYQHDAIDDAPDYDQMVTMFGPPEEMARTLMEEVSQEEQLAYRRNRLFLRIISFVLAISFAVFSLYIFFIKEITVIEVVTRDYYGNPYVDSGEVSE